MVPFLIGCLASGALIRIVGGFGQRRKIDSIVATSAILALKLCQHLLTECSDVIHRIGPGGRREQVENKENNGGRHGC